MYHLCDYCKKRKAKFRLKNGKFCCEQYWQRCPVYVKQKQKIMKEVMNRPESKERIQKLRLGWKDSDETKEKKRKALIGNDRKKGKKESEKTRLKKSKSHKRTIGYIKKKYPLFSKIEKMRYNPDKAGEKEIQVHCKNHNCCNSKEQSGWFTPTSRQIEARLFAIENGSCGLYFYCSDECKNECPLYNLKSDPLKDNSPQYTKEEYNIWRQKVLKQDNYECQKCSSKEDLNCHHIIPVKMEAMFSLDPDNGIVLCDQCHYKYGHKTDTECSTGNLAKLLCKS
jgi:hypothetical protein